MRLSQLSTDKACDVLCTLTPYVSNIVSDKKLLNALKEKIGTKNVSAAELYTHALNKISVIIPILLKDHKKDIFGILAIINETTTDEISSQNIILTMGQIRDAVQDKELIDFFKSWQQEEKTE